MKIFISISIFAMISAGVYGLIDMSRDVFEGTMINYHQTEAELLKKETPVVKTDAVIPAPGKIYFRSVSLHSAKEKTLVIPVIDPDRPLFPDGVVMNSEFTGRENLREDSTAIKEKIRYESEHSDPVNVNPVAPADGTVTVVDTVAPPAPVVHYYEFSRGSPRN